MNCKKFKLTILVVLSFLLLPTNFVGAMDNDEAGAFAGFIQDLIRSSQLAKSGSTCVFGNDEISKILIEQDHETVDLDKDLRRLGGCKAVYIAKDREKGLRIELEKFNKHKVVTIAVLEGFSEMGGAIQVQMGRRNFELLVNSKLLKASGVKLGVLATSLIIN